MSIRIPGGGNVEPGIFVRKRARSLPQECRLGYGEGPVQNEYERSMEEVMLKSQFLPPGELRTPSEKHTRAAEGVWRRGREDVVPVFVLIFCSLSYLVSRSSFVVFIYTRTFFYALGRHVSKGLRSLHCLKRCWCLGASRVLETLFSFSSRFSLSWTNRCGLRIR